MLPNRVGLALLGAEYGLRQGLRWPPCNTDSPRRWNDNSIPRLPNLQHCTESPLAVALPLRGQCCSLYHHASAAPGIKPYNCLPYLEHALLHTRRSPGTTTSVHSHGQEQGACRKLSETVTGRCWRCVVPEDMVGGTGQSSWVRVRAPCDGDYGKALPEVTNLTGLTCQSQPNIPCSLHYTDLNGTQR